MTNAYKKSYGLVRANMDILLNSDMSCLTILSPAGMGKTTLVFKSMKELGLNHGEQFLYYNSYFTPLSFFQTLQKVTELQAPQILILDDVEMILHDKNIINFLKSATWENESGCRWVNYNSTSKLVKEKTINFTGKIIILINETPAKNPMFQAIVDRVLFTELEFSQAEILELMKTEMVAKPYKTLKQAQREKVFHFIKKNISPETELSFRTLIKAYNSMLYAPNHWQDLVKSTLGGKKQQAKSPNTII